MVPCNLPADVVAPITAPASYSYVFDATLWDAEDGHLRGTLRIAPHASGFYVSFTPSYTSFSDDATFSDDDVNIDSCASIADTQHAMLVRQYNNGVALLRNAPRDLSVGATWKSVVWMQTSLSQTTEVPVSVRVARKDASGILLQATGTASGTLAEYYSVPFTVTYEGAALFADGALKAAKCSAQEPIKAGPYSQTMKYNWNLTRL